jgi:hypothetical protein
MTKRDGMTLADAKAGTAAARLHAAEERCEWAGCGSTEYTFLGRFGRRIHVRCRACGLDGVEI